MLLGIFLAILLAFYIGCLASYPRPRTALTVGVTPTSQTPGNGVYVAGALTGDDVAGKTVTVTIKDPSNAVVATREVTTDDNGAFSLQYGLPSDAATGTWTVTAAFDSLEETATLEVSPAPP